ncbi:hypothetical protein MNBD_GAMMA09-1806 [hydrothermal vent metagenome]|uniref:tRNA-uridine aminocarboxypropyltransferase n=1 Tax=hydrothermal vent metagenome TaxID=652676 RepID=A0A3B0XIM8_9ZZZZ
MSRAFCYQCHRAKVACLCNRIEKQANRIKLVVLQHPDEVSNPKGSAIIAELGLQQYQCWVGEDFSGHKGLLSLLAETAELTAVLYPSEGSTVLDRQNAADNGDIRQLIVIDASWRKAKKIWELCPQLHRLKVFRLAERVSSYRIRKTPGADYLSTIESIVESLNLLEGQLDRYQPLLDLFTEMIDFQIEKMGRSTYQKNYTDK